MGAACTTCDGVGQKNGLMCPKCFPNASNKFEPTPATNTFVEAVPSVEVSSELMKEVPSAEPEPDPTEDEAGGGEGPAEDAPASAEGAGSPEGVSEGSEPVDGEGRDGGPDADDDA